jgi:hypothetical protein
MIRRLVESRAHQDNAKHSSSASADRGKQLAAKAIEKIIDSHPRPDERAQRRRRLTKGPEEFWKVRVDRPKSKAKQCYPSQVFG